MKHPLNFEEKKIVRQCVFTALVSVATAEVTNIIEKVTTISMIRAWRSDPEGDVVPICLIGCNRTRSVREADTAPVS